MYGAADYDWGVSTRLGTDTRQRRVLERTGPAPPPEEYPLIAVRVRLLVDGAHGASGDVIDCEPRVAEELMRRGHAEPFCGERMREEDSENRPE